MYLNQQRGQKRPAQANVCSNSVLSGEQYHLLQQSDGTALELTNAFGIQLPTTEEQANKRSRAAAQQVDTTFAAALTERSQRQTTHYNRKEDNEKEVGKFLGEKVKTYSPNCRPLHCHSSSSPVRPTSPFGSCRSSLTV